VAELELWQFPYSHFCEKTRWVLDYKKLPHRRRSLLPGFHIPTVRKVTGKTQVPVLFIDGEVVADTEVITQRVETVHPDPALFPSGDLRDPALEWERRLGEKLGPFIRRAWFYDLLQHKDYALSVFCVGAPDKAARRYRRWWWLLKVAFKLSMGVSKKKAAVAWERTETMLDEIASATSGREYLVGDSFTIADLTAAALLCPMFPKEWHVLGEPVLPPPDLAEVAVRYREHPGMLWAQGVWERHRGESAELRES